MSNQPKVDAPAREEESLRIEDLRDSGLDDAQADALWPLIQDALNLEPEQRFLKLARDVLRADHPFALHQLLYRSCNNDKIVWEPDASQVEKANVTQLMRERGLESHEDLHAWSVTDRYAFWQSIVAKLAILFRTKHTRVLDTNDHPENARFFPDSRLNIAESCFNAARSATAIVYQREGGTIQRITYGELMRMTRQVAAGLRVMGIEPGAPIAIDMPMTAESVAIYLGIVWAGCSVVSIADSFAAEEIPVGIKAQLIFTQDVVLRGGKTLPLYERVVAANAPPAIVLDGRTDHPAVLLRRSDITWSEFLGKEETDAAICTSETHINVLFSSGTTGQPKAIPWTHTTPIKCAADGYLHHDIHQGEVVAWPTNLGWMMGPWLIYASLINRATIALYTACRQEQIF